MTIEEMQQRKRELGLTYEQIAERSGLSVITVKRIITGTTPNPRGYTKSFIEMALSDPVVRDSAAPARSAYASENGIEPQYMNKKQGEYTAEDYFALPDEERCELIDGVIYDFASPTDLHQEIAGELYYQLKQYIRDNKGSCRAVIAPSDVKIGANTVLQPDVYVHCKGWKRGEEAPAFVAEVVSPSTKVRDYRIKYLKYQETGAKEYWILDPYNEKITAYLFDGDDFDVRISDLYAPMPVSIWDDKCVVDLSVLKEELAEMAE